MKREDELRHNPERGGSVFKESGTQFVKLHPTGTCSNSRNKPANHCNFKCRHRRRRAPRSKQYVDQRLGISSTVQSVDHVGQRLRSLQRAQRIADAMPIGLGSSTIYGTSVLPGMRVLFKTKATSTKTESI